MPGIFISYRREDTAGHAGRIFDRLRDKFGQDKVFMDVADIEPGVDFVEAIDRAVGSCDVLLVVIGKRWLTCTDAAGKRRLDDAKDFIRLETATALRRDIRVIPVLVQGATMPAEGDLPDDLKKLVRRQATDISDTHWDASIEQLIGTVAKVLAGAPKSMPALAEAAREVPGPIAFRAEAARDIPGPRPARWGGKKPAWILSAMAAVALLVAGAFYLAPPKQTEVPNLIGRSLDEAVARLEQAHLLPGAVKPVPSDRPAGSVIEQDPAPGSRLAPESRVNLVLAQAAREPGAPPAAMAEVPKLLGQPLERAHRLLEEAGLKAAQPVRRETREAAEGTVLEQAPQAGAKLARGAPVELVIAVSPAEPAMVRVPDVTGQDIKKAIAVLMDAGLASQPKVQRRETTEVKPGTVLSQSIEPGAHLRPDETIALVYAVAPPAGDIVLPDFTGSPIVKVEDYLKRTGLVLAPVREKATDEQKPGTVLAQRPPAKTRVSKGAEVTLLVAVSPELRAALPAPKQTWPENGHLFDNYPRRAAVSWKAVSGAASYTVELDCLDCCAAGEWCADRGKPWKVIRGIKPVQSPGYKFEFVRAQPGRWRVWAVDEQGREGEKSPWRTFRFTR